MKKLLFILAGTFLVSLGYGQNNNGQSAARVMTVEEANRTNGTVEPTINGKPYSQYKAEQDALKQQRQQQAKPVVMPASQVLNASAARTNPVQNTTLQNGLRGQELEAKSTHQTPAAVTADANGNSTSATTAPVTKPVSIGVEGRGTAPVIPVLQVKAADITVQKTEAQLPAGIKLTPGTVETKTTEAKAADAGSSDGQAKTKSN